MLYNLAENVLGLSIRSGSLSIVHKWDGENCPLYRVVGCLLFRDCFKYGSEWKDFQRCPLYHGWPLLRDVC